MSKTSENFSLIGFSTESVALIGQAQKFADDNKCRFFDPAHLLAVLLDLNDISQLFRDLGINTVVFANQLHGYLSKLSVGEDTCALAPVTQEMLTRSKTNIAPDKRPVNVFDLLYSLSQEKQGITGTLCKAAELTPERISSHLNKGKDRDLDSSPYFTNLSLLAKKEQFDTIIGRDNEVRRLIQILGRRSKHNPLLVGEAGVGKRTIVLSLVDRILNKSVPKALLDVSVLQLNTANLVSGAKARTDVETRLKNALKSVQGYNVIVYVRSLDALLVPGLNLNLNDLVGLFWEVPGLRVIAATSPDGLKKLTEKETHLLQEFTQLQVEPCTPECAIEVLRGVAGRYEKHHTVKIGEAAITTAVKLAARYIQNKFLPESAIDLLDESASRKLMEATGTHPILDKIVSRLSSVKAQLSGLSGSKDTLTSKAIMVLENEMKSLTFQLNSHSDTRSSGSGEEIILTEDNIATVLGEMTGIPASKFTEGENEKLSRIHSTLSAKVIDQNEAVNAVCQAIKRSRAGLRNARKPIGSFLFFGSSGTGKTLLAKKVAEFLFDSEDNMIRIDMSEFMEKHSVAKLLGSPPGYQGSEDGGFLTEAIKKKPYAVLLLDEIEKAHPDVFNILLSILDDGRLSDSKGKVVDFSNVVIVLTSNIGSKKFLECNPALFDTKEGVDAIRASVNADINGFFRPEFLNRIDAQVIFKPLTKNSLRAILDIELRKIEALIAERGIKLYVAESAKEALVELGYNPAFGARPVHRAIMSNVQDPLAEKLLSSEYTEGSTMKISFNDGRFVFG